LKGGAEHRGKVREAISDRIYLPVVLKTFHFGAAGPRPRHSRMKEGDRMKFQRIVATGLALVFALVASSGLAVAAAKPAPSGKVNINTATAQQLTVLPGVGEKLAARIVDYRQKSGGFKNVSELMNVQGIGEKNLAKIQAFLTTGDAAKPAASK